MSKTRPFRPYGTRCSDELRYIKQAIEKIGEPVPVDLVTTLAARGFRV